MSNTVALTKPSDVGLDPDRVDALLARARDEVDRGRLDAIQIALARKHQLVAFETYGDVIQAGTNQKASDTTLFHVYSVSKGLVGIAFWKLIEEGKVSPRQRVAEFIPEFGTYGKDVITVEQVLSHQGGFPSAQFDGAEALTSDGRRQAFARWVPEYPAGEVYEAHAVSGHYVLVEIMQSLTGEDFRHYITRFAQQASGTEDVWLGLPTALHHRVADVVWKGEQIPPPGGWKQVPPEAVLSINSPLALKAGLPGGGGLATSAALALFYQTFVNGGVTAKGEQLLKPETIAKGTTVVTRPDQHDDVTDSAPNRALSVVVAGPDPNERAKRNFARSASPRAFGHGGVGGQVAWGDPDTGLSFAFCTNSVVSPQSEWFERGAELGELAARTLSMRGSL